MIGFGNPLLDGNRTIRIDSERARARPLKQACSRTADYGRIGGNPGSAHSRSRVSAAP